MEDNGSLDSREIIQAFVLPIGPRRPHAALERGPRPLRPSIGAGNRRDSARVALEGWGLVVQLERDLVTGIDLSVCGIQFVLDRRLAPGAPLLLKLSGLAPASSHALARVRWSSDRPADDRYLVGARFEQADVPALRSILARCGLMAPAVNAPRGRR